MHIDTAKVQGRRELHFTNLDQILQDAQEIAQSNPHALGNWSAGQIFMHLARSMDASIDGADWRLPWVMRLIVRTMKRRMLTQPMPSGFKLPEKARPQFVPGETTVEAGLTGLRDALARLQRTPERKPHAAFGNLTRDEWDQLHLRHAELHLGFLVRENGQPSTG